MFIHPGSVIGELNAGRISRRSVTPESLGFRRASMEELTVSGVQESASALRAVLAGEPGARRDMTLLNAGAAVYVAGLAPSVQEGVEAAAESIDSGRARETLEGLIALTNSTG